MHLLNIYIEGSNLDYQENNVLNSECKITCYCL